MSDKKEKDWALINFIIATVFLSASLICYFVPGLFGTGIIFLILGIISTFFVAIS